METFNSWRYEILKNNEVPSRWYYKIYSANGKMEICRIKDIFKSEGEARFAAIGHISKLEKMFNNLTQQHS